MNGMGWLVAELASKLLERDEREAVLGDLLEANESAWQGFLDICGLVLRRQAGFWKAPRPWLAGFGVALPSGYLLMGVSLSVSCTYQRLINHKVYDCWWPTGHEGFSLLLCHTFLLIAWSWVGGYVVGSASRRTLWVSAAMSLLPFFTYLGTFRLETLSRVCLFLFLVPAILGVRQGMRNARISLRSASLLALTITVLMISAWSSKALWIFNWALVWPAWYLVATAWRSGQQSQTGSWPIDHATCARVSLP